MIIRLERSGGFSGIPASTEFDSEDLPSALVDLIKKIMEDKKANPLPLKVAPKGGADHYTYTISMDDGLRKRTIVCDQYGLQGDLKSLVKQLQKFSNKG